MRQPVLRRIIIIATIVLVPTSFYIASKYGELETVTYQQAVQKSATDYEEDQVPKVIITSSLVGMEGQRFVCEDEKGVQFTVEYTGEPPSSRLSPGVTVDFVGHVHGGNEPYFHATQVYTR